LIPELMDFFVAGRDQSAADQLNNLLAEVTPYGNHWVQQDKTHVHAMDAQGKRHKRAGAWD